MQIDHQLIEIKLRDIIVEGDFAVPETPTGFIIFAHGSGTSSNQPKNKYLAEKFKSANFGYLLFDLLTEEEDRNTQNKYDIENLTQRLIQVTQWVEKNDLNNSANLGYFGAGTGTATALRAAARMPDSIKTVVTRGGRADMAVEELLKVNIPVFMILGSKDEKAIRLNEKAAELLPYSEIVILEGASNLFEETGALEELGELSTRWFKEKFR